MNKLFKSLLAGLSFGLVVATAVSCVHVTPIDPAPTPSQREEEEGKESTSTGFEIPEGGYDGSDVEISFYHTMSATTLQPVLQAYIEEFNKLYPNITITETQIGGYDDVRNQIKSELSVGTQPNIAYCYPDHVALYNKAKGVVALDPLIESTATVTRADGTTEQLGLTQEQKDDFIEGYYEEGRQFGDGLMYTMPFSKSTEVLYYDKTFFTNHGLSVPTTWDEMEEVCKKIKAIDPKSIPLGYDSEANWFITMCEQLKSPYTSATGDHYLFNNAKNQEFVTKFKGWYDKGYVTTQTIYGTYTSGLFVSTEEQRSYMCIGSSAGATHQLPDAVDGVRPFEVGITSIPQADASNKKCISQGPDVCIFKNDDPQKVIASWLFVKYLTTSVAFQAEFASSSGYIPVIKSVAQSDVYKAYMAKADGISKTGIAALSASVCLEQESYYFTSPAFVGSSEARDQVGTLMSSAISGSKTVEQAFKDAIQECEYNG